MMDSTDNLTPGPIRGPIPDPIPEPILLAYCDGELDAAQTTDVDARVADDAVLAERVEHERELARRVRAAMSVEFSVGLPVGLADRVRGAVAEVIVGVVHEPQFGLALIIGAGGELVELIDDSATLLLPTDREAVVEALDTLRISRLLAGYRGRPAGDHEALIEAVLGIAALAEETLPFVAAIGEGGGLLG